MGLPLTSQEKKVLGFILFLLALGLSVLGYRGAFEKQDTPVATVSVQPTP